MGYPPAMRHRPGSARLLLAGLALVLGIAGCGGTEAADASSPTSHAVDPDVAFKAYDAAARPLECSSASLDMDNAARAGNFGTMKYNALQYRDLVAKLDDQLGKIDFPAETQPIVKRLRDINADHMAVLNDLGQYDGNDKERLGALRNRAWLDDSSWMVDGDRLRAALGHPVHQAGYAADLVESAQATFYNENAPTHAKWEAAMATKDLAAAKAANDIEIGALQRYIDKLDAIEWPPGTFADQASTLRDHLRGFIEFDRKQVDVATAEDIIAAPAEGIPDVKAAEDAKDKLWTGLVTTYQAMDPAAKC
jgi:hypothetical protein